MKAISTHLRWYARAPQTHMTTPGAMLIPIVLLLGLLCSFNVLAAIVVQYTYLDPYGAPKTATSTTSYINPNGPVTLALAAGLDRKVEASWVDAIGMTVGIVTSEILTATDRITINGTNYYGSLLDLEPPAEDGNYTLRARILSVDGTQIAVENYPVVVDRTPPALLGDFGWKAWRPSDLYPMPDDTLISFYEAKRLWIQNVVDTDAGLDANNAQFQSMWLEGADAGLVYRAQPAIVDIANGTIAIGTGSSGSVKRNIHFPAENAQMLARFVVFDRAGNVANFDKTIYWHGKCVADSVEMYSVYDPDNTGNLLPGSTYTGFVPYVAGMDVKTNPVRMLLRIPRNEWWEDTTFGLSIAHRLPNQSASGWPKDPADFKDDTYAYEEIVFPYVQPGEPLSPDYRMSAPTVYGGCSPASVVPNLQLAATAPRSPVIVDISLQWEQEQIVPVYQIRANAVNTLLSLTITVEARPYDQTYQAGPIGSCVIPANGTTCTINGPYVMGDTSDGMELNHYWSRLRGVGDPFSDLVSEAKIIDWEFDVNPPTVDSVTLSDSGVTAQLLMTEYMTGDWWGRITLNQAWLEAENIETGVITTINSTNLESTDGVLNWKATINTAQITEGVYNLRFYAKDNYDNVSQPFEILNHVSDRVAPVIEQYITSGDALNGARISSLNQVRFKVNDTVDQNPMVTDVRLTGGPVNDDINLGFYKSGTEYRVEFPVMLPSIEAGDYRLWVTAKDAYGNTRTVSAVFDYGPARFGLLPENGDVISLPRIDVPTRLSNNNWPLTTDPAIMTDAGGMSLIGKRNLSITLSSDAQGSVVIGGLTVAPGVTVVYPNYDFTANKSALALPMHFANPEEITEGHIGTIVVQINHPDTPVFAEDIEAWDPAGSIEITQASPSFAKQVETASIKLSSGGTQKCETMVAIVEGDSYRNLRYAENSAICAIQWVNLPPDLQAMRLDRSKVGGLIRSFESSVDLSYQPGLLIKQNNAFVFHPIGTVVAHQVDLYDPDPPIITVSPTAGGTSQKDWLPTGIFPSLQGPYVSGYANGRADYPGLTMKITDLDSGAVVLDNLYSSSFARGAMETNISELEGEKSFKVDVSYTNHPTIAATADVTFVALPKKPVIQLMRPETPDNMTDTVVSGRFGTANKNEFTFKESAMGRWMVRIYKQQVGAGQTTTRTQLGTNTTDIASDGAFSINLGKLDPGVYAILATATYQSTSQDITATVESLPTVIKVNNGDPISFVLTTSRSDGRPPMTATAKMSLMDVARAPDVGSINWERSNDGVTFEPIDLDERRARSFGYGERLTESGKYWYRATSVNRYSGRTYRSDPIKIHIYDIPTITFSGYNYTFTNYPVEWKVIPEETGRPIIYKWSVRRGNYKAEPVEYTGQTQTFDASINGSWYITVLARYSDAPDVKGSWRKASALLKVAPPYMSRPRIVGPSYIEKGKTYQYTTQTYAVTRGNADPNIRVTGRWELPDGTTSTADTIDYTAQTGDTEIKYTAWVQGYRAETEQTSLIKLRIWEYQFPEFRMYKRQVREYDPVRYSYTLMQTGKKMGTEKPIYDWNFPAGVSVEQRSVNSVIVSASTQGDYEVSARAYDTRGNEAVIDDTFSVEDPPTLTASIRALIGDAWQRVPARTTVRWYVDGMLSKERVSGIIINVDGEQVSDRVLSSYSFDITESGTHNIDIALETTYGRSATYSDDVTLVDGEPPICEIVTTGDAARSLRAQASCEIPMGRILSYHWWVTYTDTGETRDLGLRSSAISFITSELDRGISQIQLVVVNDKGQESIPALWNN